MSTLVTLKPQFMRLPMEVVHQICIYTGKFIFDINGNLKSIINIADFKNIQTLMLIHDYHQNKYLFQRFTNDDKIRFIKELYSDRLLDNTERIKEEVLSVENVDYFKQSYLFTKSSTIEEVMIPDKLQVDPNEYCNKCFSQKLLTKNPEKKTETSLPIKKPNVFNFVNGIFGNFGGGYWYYVNQPNTFIKKFIKNKKRNSCDKNYCEKCNNVLVPTKIKSVQDFKKKSVKFDRLVKKPNVIKNFRRLI